MHAKPSRASTTPKTTTYAADTLAIVLCQHCQTTLSATTTAAPTGHGAAMLYANGSQNTPLTYTPRRRVSPGAAAVGPVPSPGVIGGYGMGPTYHTPPQNGDAHPNQQNNSRAACTRPRAACTPWRAMPPSCTWVASAPKTLMQC